MTYQEVYEIISGCENREADVVITGQSSDKQYKQHLYINSLNILKIRGYKSKIVGYNVDEGMANHWSGIRLIKSRKKNK